MGRYRFREPKYHQ